MYHGSAFRNVPGADTSVRSSARHDTARCGRCTGSDKGCGGSVVGVGLAGGMFRDEAAYVEFVARVVRSVVGCVQESTRVVEARGIGYQNGDCENCAVREEYWERKCECVNPRRCGQCDGFLLRCSDGEFSSEDVKTRGTTRNAGFNESLGGADVGGGQCTQRRETTGYSRCGSCEIDGEAPSKLGQCTATCGSGNGRECGKFGGEASPRVERSDVGGCAVGTGHVSESFVARGDAVGQCVGASSVGASASKFSPEEKKSTVEKTSGKGDVSERIWNAGSSDRLDGNVKKGKWHDHNKRKKDRWAIRKAESKAEFDRGCRKEDLVTNTPVWRRGVSAFNQSVGKCETVKSDSGYETDALISAEVKARETLALRRVAENEVAIAKAKALCASYADEAKCEAIQELAALRIAQRANEARAKSQSSWKKCEESLGSLGSTGSAGEFWMKKEVEKGRQWEKKYQILKKQSEHMYANVTQQVRDELLAMDGTITTVESECFGGADDVDDYLAQNVGAAGKSLADMEEEFRNFKF